MGRPAGVVMCDGTARGLRSTANGLRPARWTLSDDGVFVIASEAGVNGTCRRRCAGQARPGRDDRGGTWLAGRLLDNDAIDALNRATPALQAMASSAG